jgi:hypothetical protein
MVLPEIRHYYRRLFGGAFRAAPDLVPAPNNAGIKDRTCGRHPSCFYFDSVAGFRNAFFRIATICARSHAEDIFQEKAAQNRVENNKQRKAVADPSDDDQPSRMLAAFPDQENKPHDVDHGDGRGDQAESVGRRIPKF